MSFIGVTDRSMAEVLFSGVETTLRQLHRQSPPQHRWQITRPGLLEHSVHPSRSAAGRKEFFPIGLVALTLF